MNTSDYTAVAVMYFRAIAPALVPAEQANYGIAMVLLYVEIRIHSKETRIRY